MKPISLLVAILFSLTVFSQNQSDALRYSQTMLTGTARFTAMGGSFGALGGDFSSLSFNPAGIGIYRRSEFVLTPSVFTQSTKSTYLGQTTMDDKYNFNFGNLGVVFAGANPKEDAKWKSFAFALGFNRLNNFHNNVSIIGTNKTSSLLDVYVAESGTSKVKDLNDFSAGLAYDAFLTEWDSATNSYFHVLPNYGEKQQKNITTSGRISETVFSGGANYMDKLYIGATIGIDHIVYAESSTYRESLSNPDPFYAFKYYQLNSDLNTSGNGVNFKVGLIYRAADWLRLGAAIHTPTFYSLTYSYNYSIISEFGQQAVDKAIRGKHSATSPDGNYNYSVRAPFKAIGSAGFVIGKRGLLNVDYEYIDYSTIKLAADKNAFSSENAYMQQHYTATSNIRVGGELRIDPFAIRAGYGLYGSPYKNNNGNILTGARANYSFGLGYRADSFYADFAYALSLKKEGYYMFDPNYFTVAEEAMTSSTFLITLGFRF